MAPTAEGQPAVFVTDVGESQYKSVLQMAFLAAGTQQGSREDVPSCDVTPTDSCLTLLTVGRSSFIFSLPTTHFLHAKDLCLHSHKEAPASRSDEFPCPDLHCRPHTLILPSSTPCPAAWSFQALRPPYIPSALAQQYFTPRKGAPNCQCTLPAVC